MQKAEKKCQKTPPPWSEGWAERSQGLHHQWEVAVLPKTTFSFVKSHFQSDSRLKVSDKRYLARRYLADGAQGYRITLAPLGTIKDSFASQARGVGTIQSEGHFRTAHAGPHLWTLPTAGKCVRGHFQAGIGIYQSGREPMSCSDLSSGLTWWMQVRVGVDTWSSTVSKKCKNND